jgi:hypothetical protein
LPLLLLLLLAVADLNPLRCSENLLDPLADTASMRWSPRHLQHVYRNKREVGLLKILLDLCLKFVFIN